MATELKQRSVQAAFLDNIGSLQRLAGDWEQGVEKHQQALQVMIDIKSIAGEALVRSHLGVGLPHGGRPRSWGARIFAGVGDLSRAGTAGQNRHGFEQPW